MYCSLHRHGTSAVLWDTTTEHDWSNGQFVPKRIQTNLFIANDLRWNAVVVTLPSVAVDRDEWSFADKLRLLNLKDAIVGIYRQLVWNLWLPFLGKT